MERSKVVNVEELDTNSVVVVLERCDMVEFTDFIREKQLDGRKLLEVTEGIVKLWRPKANAKRFILFVQDLKLNPEKYISCADKQNDREVNGVSDPDIADSINDQYQIVKTKKERQNASTSLSGVEEILERVVPVKSFLYRNQTDKIISSYVPMDAIVPKKQRRFFRLSSYEYPLLDLRLKKHDGHNDRGYYTVKSNSRFYIQKIYKKSEGKKYKSLSTPEELLEKFPEDHFYEDLCYNDVVKDGQINKIEPGSTSVKPCLVKIQELFQSFKFPFFKKNDDDPQKDKKAEAVNEREGQLNENNGGCNSNDMYDSVHVNNHNHEDSTGTDSGSVLVEDYLEPIQVSKDYCDVDCREKEESLLSYIMNIFESRFRFRRDASDANQSEYSEVENSSNAREVAAAAGTVAKWIDESRKMRTNMADRPLPVPVENEPYYMNIDRSEAENLLRGQPDGTFLLRPSSQPSHAYTLSVSCAGAVHNVGVRRRPDGRLALGFPRRGERSFAGVPSLLRHHRRRRLLLVAPAGAGVIGGTTLLDSPHYYQTPNNIPVPVPVAML